MPTVTRYALVSILLGLVVAPAQAQVEEGRDALANAEFDRAIRAFDEAERGPLDREAYISLLEGRALASWATGDTDRARADLAKLAAIDPRHVPPREAPPELTDLFRDTVRSRGGPIAASALYTPSGDALTITVRNDDLGLVSEIRTHLRTGAAWSIVLGTPPAATVPIDGATRAEAWVELVGPGGAVLATRGSEAAPIVWERSPGAGDSSSSSSAAGDDTALFVGLGIGGAVIAIAVVIAIVLAVSSGGSGGAQPGAPVVVGF